MYLFTYSMYLILTYDQFSEGYFRSTFIFMPNANSVLLWTELHRCENLKDLNSVFQLLYILVSQLTLTLVVPW